MTLSNEQVLEICKRIDDAKAGKGTMPGPDEIRAALDALRANKRAIPAKGSKSKTPAAPVDLNSLFN